MARLAGDTAREIRRAVPAAQDAWRQIEVDVLERGVVDQGLKELCYRALANGFSGIEGHQGRERLALEWAYAIAYDSAQADDALWSRLHASFSEPELVDLGCAIGFELGRQHWRRTVGLPARGE